MQKFSNAYICFVVGFRDRCLDPYHVMVEVVFGEQKRLWICAKKEQKTDENCVES